MIYLKEGKTPLNFAFNDEIVHEGNGKYQLSFKFPIDNPIWESLTEETLLLADDLHGEQEFIIFEVERHHADITVYANQVATLLNNYSITELSVNNASGDRVMRSLVSSIRREHKFTFSSDIANTHNLNLKNITVANALFKGKHSILGQWGGDLIRDKYDIRLLSNGGSDKESLFMYKKNLKTYQQKKSIKDLKTRIHFTKTINSKKEGEKDKVISVTVDSPLINKYKNIYESNLDVNDQEVTDETTLRRYGEKYFKTTLCDVLEETIEIDVVGTPDVAVGIFDTVTVFHEKFNLDVKKKITKYTYSPMGKKLKTIGFGKIQSNLGSTLSNMVDNAVAEQVESKLDAFKIQKNLAELLKLDRKAIENKMADLEEKSKAAVEVKKALFEADGTIPNVVKTKILDAVEADIARLKTIITEAELIKAIQAHLNYAEIKNALIDKAFINQIISDEKFTQQFEDGQVTTQNIFTKLKDSIKSNIAKDFVTKAGVQKIVNDLTIDADGIRQITQAETTKIFNQNRESFKGERGKNSYIHKKYSDNANGSNMDNNPTRQYIGIYTGDKEQAPDNASEYSWTKIRGNDGINGRDGQNGRDGVDGKSINRNYITDSQNLTNITSGGTNWEKTVENGTLVFTKVRATENTGIWTQIMPFLKDNFQNEVLTWSIDVKASKNISFNNVGQETNGFKGRVDITTQWQRISHTFTNRYTQYYSFVFYQMIGTCSPGDKIYIRLPKLEKGNIATEWSPAYEDLRGRDGVSNYIHKKYSDYSNGSNMSDDSNLKYIGIYTGTSPTPPATASSYLWSKIKGEDGANGTPGTKGADGRTPYFHTAYSNSPTGDRDFSTTNSSNKLYIGTYSDFEVADSTDYRKYKWVKIKGEDGVSSYIYRKYSDNANGSPMSDNSNLKYIGIYTGTSPTAPTTPSAYTWSKIKGEDGQQGVPGIRGVDGRTSYLHTAYANSATGDRDFSTTNSNGKEYIGTYTDFEMNDSNDYRRYKWMKIKGENGLNGRDGEVNFNLLNGTKDFKRDLFGAPENWQRNLIWNTESEKYKDFTVLSTLYNANGLWQNVEVKQGKMYEYGFYAKAEVAHDKAFVGVGWTASTAKTPIVYGNPSRFGIQLTTDWKFYTFRFTAEKNGWTQTRLEQLQEMRGKKLYLCGLYLKEVKNNQSEPLEWSPSFEDLQAHTLTANVRFEGTYKNNITTNVRVFAEVYYDGQRVIDGFNLKIKHKGGNNTDWGGFFNRNYNQNGEVLQYDWGNKEQNGLPLEVIVLIDYKGMSTVATARLENVPDVAEIKETIRKYKTFESTLDRFNSTIGEVKEQVVNGNRNYVTKSSTLEWVGWGGPDWNKTIQNETIIFTKNNSGTGGIYIHLMPFLKDDFQNQTVTWSMDVKASRSITLGSFGQETNGIKNNVTLNTNWQRIAHTFTNRFTQYSAFVMYYPTSEFNVGDKIYIRYPKLEKGSVATEWSLAPEDVSLVKETLESSINQTKDKIELKVSKDNVISAINASVERYGNGYQSLVKINADKVDITGVLRAYAGIIGGFRLGPIDYYSGQYITGANQFSVGMSNGAGNSPGRAALWVNWGRDWNTFPSNGWVVTHDGTMYAHNGATFKGGVSMKDTLYIERNGGELMYKGESLSTLLNKRIPIVDIYRITRQTDANGPYVGFESNRGNVYTRAANWSDKNLKSNIAETKVDALDAINKLNVYEYDFKKDDTEYHKSIGLIAQEVGEHLPDAHETFKGIETYNPFFFIPYLVKSIQQLSAENEKLNKKLEELEDKINGKL